jgi:hypothetical protein
MLARHSMPRQLEVHCRLARPWNEQKAVKYAHGLLMTELYSLVKKSR